MRNKWWIIAVVILVGCSGQGPQRPSQRMGRSPEPDSSQLALIEFNHRMAEAADSELMHWVQAQPEKYALYEMQAWMCIRERGDEDAELLKRNDRCVIHMQVYDINGRLLTDTQRQYQIGKMELPPAVEANIRSLSPHAKARMAIPWYTAFGMQGNDDVPPYTNVIIDLEIL